MNNSFGLKASVTHFNPTLPWWHLPRVLTLYELYVSVIFSASLAFQVPFDLRLVALLYITADDILTSLLAVSPWR